MATENTVSEKLTLDRSDGSATLELYRAALGPVRTDYYLRAFTRFDAAGKAGRSWNWNAALVTLNWLAFRRLWGPALAYAGATIATLLFLFGILPLAVALPPAGLWALLGLALVLAVAVPGLYANQWLYKVCNQSMEAALKSSATLEDACALLQQRAPGRQRMGLLAGVNVALCAVVVAVVLAWPSSSELPFNTRKMEHARAEASAAGAAIAPVAPLAMASAAAAPASSASAAAATPAAIASAPSVATAPAAAASATAVVRSPTPQVTPTQASRTSQGLVQAAPSAASPQASAPVGATSAAVTATAPMAASATTKKETPAAAAVAETQKTKTAMSDKTEKSDKPGKAELQAQALAAKKEKADKDKAAKAARAASAPAAAPTDKASATGAGAVTGSEKYLINVGLFADANNARNAYTKLMDAGMPALTQELESAKGTRTRVRVGPFETRAEADAAAEKIRALKLDAAVFKP